MKNCLRPPISDHIFTRPLCHHKLIPQKKIIKFWFKVFDNPLCGHRLGHGNVSFNLTFSGSNKL